MTITNQSAAIRHLAGVCGWKVSEWGEGCRIETEDGRVMWSEGIRLSDTWLMPLAVSRAVARAFGWKGEA